MTYPSLLLNNAYNVLGLDGSSPSNEIKKRAQLLLQLTKIGEVEKYETDIGDTSQIRKASIVKNALEKLSSIKGRLHETFFWFEIQTIEDRNLLRLIAQKKHQKAVETLAKAKKSDWLAQKNLALSLMFNAFFIKSSINGQGILFFQQSLEIWKKLIESDSFWNFYQKYYSLHEEIGTSKSFFCEFRDEISIFLEKLSSDFYSRNQDPKILKFYYEIFGNINGSLDTEILQPLVSKIKECVDDIYKYANSSQSRKKSRIKSLLKKLSSQYTELYEYGLCAYSPIAVLKNDVAEKLRSASISVYNSNDDEDLAGFILDQAAQFASSEDIMKKIQNDKKTILTNQIWASSIAPKVDKMKSLIHENQFSEAYHEYLSFDKEITNQEAFWENDENIELLLVCCGVFIKKGNELMEKELYELAANAFYYPFEILLARVQTLKFYSSAKKREYLNQFLVSLIQNAKDFESEKIPILFERVEQEAKQHKDENLQTVIEFLGAAAIHRALCTRITSAKRMKVLKWIGWGALIIFYFFIIND